MNMKGMLWGIALPWLAGATALAGEVTVTFDDVPLGTPVSGISQDHWMISGLFYVERRPLRMKHVVPRP